MQPYDFCIETAKSAGELLLHLRDEGFETTAKGGDARDIVTSVDMAVSAYIVEEIKKAYPTDGIYSEEGGGVETTTERQWVIDPIDGSANFSRGIPHFAVVIGLLEGTTPVAGVVYNPVTGDLFSFKKGGGAFLNGKPIHVSGISELNKAQVLLHAGRHEDMWEWGARAYGQLLRFANKTKNLSGASLDACFVAAGRVEANIYGRLSTTLDLAPALGILVEAGGVSSDASGNPLSFSSEPQKVYMANNAAMLEAVRNLLES